MKNLVMLERLYSICEFIKLIKRIFFDHHEWISMILLFIDFFQLT
jgi:hypothetical protein